MVYLIFKYFQTTTRKQKKITKKKKFHGGCKISILSLSKLYRAAEDFQSSQIEYY